MEEDQTNVLMSDIRDEAMNLLKTQDYLLNGTAMVECQKRCLSFMKNSKSVTADEKECLHKCADQFSFMDMTRYELDSAE